MQKVKIVTTDLVDEITQEHGNILTIYLVLKHVIKLKPKDEAVVQSKCFISQVAIYCLCESLCK